MLAKAISILTWPLRLPLLFVIWLQQHELRILRARWEEHLKTLPEDEQRRERAEVEAELAKAGRKSRAVARPTCDRIHSRIAVVK